MKKRSSFLLLELLIAISLISLCSVSLLQPSYVIAKEKLAYLQLMQLNHYSKERFVALKMMILEKQLTLPHETQKTIQGELEGVRIIEGGTQKSFYRCFYEIEQTKMGQEKNNKRPYLFTMTLTFEKRVKDKKTFTYSLYVEEVQA